MKIDLMKVYDLVEWGFLDEVLHVYSFSHWLVNQIIECATTARFFISLNGWLLSFPVLEV